MPPFFSAHRLKSSRHGNHDSNLPHFEPIKCRYRTPVRVLITTRTGLFQLVAALPVILTFGLLLAPTRVLAGNSRFRLSTQIGVTQAAYWESPGDIMANQLTPHLKLGLDYGLIQDRLDLGFVGYTSGFANVSATLQQAQDPATYWGVAFRASLSLTRKSSPWDLRIAPGYSAWGMSVPKNTYGIGLLAAPLCYISIKNRKSGRRPWSIYVKLTPTAADFDIISKNRELALGGDFMLSRPQAKRPLVLTLDIAETLHSKALSSTIDQSFSLLSASLGLLIRW